MDRHNEVWEPLSLIGTQDVYSYSIRDKTILYSIQEGIGKTETRTGQLYNINVQPTSDHVEGLMGIFGPYTRGNTKLTP